ncbi:MAG: four helix bundle protein [Mangrovibacterium sp.]
MSNEQLKVFKEEMKIRTKKFAHNCVHYALKLPNTFLGNHIRGQLIRCSTSVASNYRAACIAQSIPSFVAKVSIVIEEADESEFWLEFSLEEKIGDPTESTPLILEAKEIASIMIKSRQSVKNSNSKSN